MRLFDPHTLPESGPEARAAVDAWKRRKRKAVYVGELVQLYLRHTERRATHGRSRRRLVERVLKMWVTKHGAAEAGHMRQMYLDDFVDSRPTWRTENTRRAVAAVVHTVFEWGEEQGRIRRNPFNLKGYPEGERGVEMTDDLHRRYCQAACKEFDRFLRLMRLTGCREGELCNANWADLDLDRGAWTVEVHKTRKHTKKAKLLMLVPEAVAFLRSLRPDDAADGDPVLRNTRGGRWTPKAVGKQLRTLKAVLGVKGPQAKASLHGIRHQFITTGLVNGAPEVLLAEQVGHNTTATIHKYYKHLRGQPEAVRAAARLALPRAN